LITSHLISKAKIKLFAIFPSLNVLFNKGHSRSIKAKRNILYSFFLKGGSIIISLLLVPLTINYIDSLQYGIWLTISSIVYWLNIFDIGINNGLKNEIAVALALKDESKLKKYVSTSYAILGTLAILILLLFLLISHFINWNKVLNIYYKVPYNIFKIIFVVVSFFCIQFVTQIIDAILSATQEIFKSSLILFIGQLLGLVTIYILTFFVKGSLLLLVTVMAGSPIIAIVLSSIFLYNTSLKKFSPTIKCIDFKYVKKLLNVGLVFFVIQIASMVLIYSDNFIIVRVLGPKEVTAFYIAFRLFSVISLLFSIVIMPYWSAFTDAYAINDLNWIKISIKKIRLIFITLSGSAIILYIFSSYIYKIWLKDSIQIPITLSFSIMIYVIIYMWQTLHVYFLNGVGKLRLQLLVIIPAAIVNIPLAISLGRIYGLPGIVYANCIIFLIIGIIFTVQYEKIVSNKASRIWNK
jgi:O-antigen/teichoic acid export membrane protein